MMRDKFLHKTEEPEMRYRISGSSVLLILLTPSPLTSNTPCRREYHVHRRRRGGVSR